MAEHTVFFATGNSHKVQEIQTATRDFHLYVKQVDIKGVEIQADSVEEIATYSAIQTKKKYKIPVFVEDTGLFIDGLQGFPGVYASYIYNTIGIHGVLKLLDGASNRGAIFRSSIAYCDLNDRVTCFTGECRGKISSVARGGSGFGFDPIFEPDDGGGKTFGEMKMQEKNRLSHRSQAAVKFACWYVKHMYNSERVS
jgi:XTP/dITP diphosphohydrolase